MTQTQQPADDHPWKVAWKRTEGKGEPGEPRESTLEAASSSSVVADWLSASSSSVVADWLSAHSSDMIDCPLGPVGIRILPSICALRQRAFSDDCTCAHPPILPLDRVGTLAGDADHFKLKGQRGNLAQKYGKKAADAFTRAAAPEALKGTAGDPWRSGGARYIQDREADNWERDNADRELVKDIVRGRVKA